MTPRITLAATRRRPPGTTTRRLFDEHGRMVVGLCRVLLRDGHEAEDAAQQTFLLAHRSLLNGTAPRRPAAWLAAIARNECRARLRSRTRTAVASAEEPASTLPDPAEIAGERADLEALKAAIAELPARQRDAFVLRDFYGLSATETAAALGVSRAVAEALLYRARKHVRARSASIGGRAWGLLTLPAALRDELARAIPGFDAATAGAGAVGAAGAAGGLAKVGALPLSAKLAAATVGVAALGAAAPELAPSPEHAQPTTPPAAAASRPGTAPAAGGMPAAEPRRSRSRLSSGRSSDDDRGREEDRSGRSGPLGDDDEEREDRERGDSSGPGGSGDPDRDEDESAEFGGSSGPGGGELAGSSGSSGSSGPGSGGSEETSNSDHGGSTGSDRGDSRGSGSGESEADSD